MRRPEEHSSECNSAVGTASAVVIRRLAEVPSEDAANRESVVAAFQQAKDRSRGEGVWQMLHQQWPSSEETEKKSLTAVATILSNLTIFNTNFYGIY